jgi:hypothetical protein
MECHVCKSPAEDITPPNCDRYSARCSKCGEYDITLSALAMLAAVAESDREAALRKSKWFAARMPSLGDRPCITTACIETRGKT